MSKFCVGDPVRFRSGKYVVTTSGKRIEYDLKDKIGRVKTVLEEGSLYEVDLLLEGRHYFLNVCMKGNIPVVEGLKPESKMSKRKCIELLQRFRSEREKKRSGRRFELCLRSYVVDAALERAIELLKGGNDD